jgi:hypothetical protein
MKVTFMQRNVVTGYYAYVMDLNGYRLIILSPLGDKELEKKVFEVINEADLMFDELNADLYAYIQSELTHPKIVIGTIHIPDPKSSTVDFR